MKRYIPLKELRSHPDKNPYISVWDYAVEYMNDPDVYISFTSIDKIGINPRSKYSTPVGIYCYPFEEFMERYVIKKVPNLDSIEYKKSLRDFAPFVGEGHDAGKYVTFFKLKSSAKNSFVKDMFTGYSNRNFSRDISILKKKYEDDFPYEWESFIEQSMSSAKEKNPIMFMWNITRELANILVNHNTRGGATKWTLVLNKDLGYSGFGDESARGYIHPSEPMQAVFFGTRYFNVITRILDVPTKFIVDQNSEEFKIAKTIQELLKKQGIYENLPDLVKEVVIKNNKIYFFKPLKIGRNIDKIPIQFEATGSIDVSYSPIKTLKNMPNEISGLLTIKHCNNLKHIDYFPKKVSGSITLSDKYKDDPKSIKTIGKLINDVYWNDDRYW